MTQNGNIDDDPEFVPCEAPLVCTWDSNLGLENRVCVHLQLLENNTHQEQKFPNSKMTYVAQARKEVGAEAEAEAK